MEVAVVDSSKIMVASNITRMVITRVIITTTSSNSNITEAMPITTKATPISNNNIMLDLVNSEHDFTPRRESEGWIK